MFLPVEAAESDEYEYVYVVAPAINQKEMTVGFPGPVKKETLVGLPSPAVTSMVPGRRAG